MNLHTLAALLTRATASMRALVGSPKIADADADLRAELEAHLAMQIDDNLRRGMSPDEARRQALVSGGGMTVAVEATRDQRGLPWLDSVGTDIRYAVRSLRKRPAFTAAVIATLALGIGANTAIFTIVDAVVLRALPYAQPDRILSLSQTIEGEDRQIVDEQTYEGWQASSRTVELSAYMPADQWFTTRNGYEQFSGMAVVRGNYFDVFRVRPILGRALSSADLNPDSPNVVVLSESLWRDGFGADSTLIGRSISVDDHPVTVIGVMPASFDEKHARFWIWPAPTSAAKPIVTLAGVAFYYDVVARLRDGATLDAARAELTTIARRTANGRFAGLRDVNLIIKTLHERRFGNQRKPVLVLFAAVLVLLLIACANLANLNLARANARQREIAVRVALGASRWRLVRGMLCESLLLSFVGAGAGIVIARVSMRYLARLNPSSVANAGGLSISSSVLLFTLGVAVITAVAFGLSPALVLARRDVNGILGAAGPRASSGPGAGTARRTLVVAQLATALLLLTGAGLVGRTFWNVTLIDAGFRPTGLFVASIHLPRAYNTARRDAFYAELTARARALPGVTGVARADAPPLGGRRLSVSMTDSAGRTLPRIDVLSVSTGYFETMGTRLLHGRTFADADRKGTEPVVVINQTLARLLFGERDPVGSLVSIRGQRRVVGVVADVLQDELEAEAAPITYFPATQDAIGARERMIVRTNASPLAAQRAIADLVRSIDASLPLPTFKNAPDILAEAAAPRQFTFLLMGAFAAIAGSLAAIGLYGLLSNLVADRTREIGIRLALGADARRITRLVLAQGTTLAMVGVGVGLVASIFAVRVVQSLLFGVSPHDPWTFAVSASVLVVVCVVASWIPARRASRVESDSRATR